MGVGKKRAQFTIIQIHDVVFELAMILGMVLSLVMLKLSRELFVQVDNNLNSV